MADAQTASGASIVHRRLRADSLLMLGTRAFVGLSNFLASALVARVLGPSSQGTIAVALTLTLLLVQLGSLGIVSANPAFVARDGTATPRIVANSLWWGAALGFLSGAAVIGLKGLAPSALEAISWPQTFIVAVAVPSALTALLLQSVLLGEGRTIAYNLAEFGLSAGSIGALTLVLFALDLGPTAAVTVLLLQYPLGALLYVCLLARHRPRFTKPDLDLARRMLKWALRLYLATVLSFLVVRFDVLLVSGYLGAEQAGYYFVAAVVAQGLYLVPMVVGMNLFPRVARGAGDHQSAAVFRSMATLYGLLCLAAALSGPPLIRFAFGDRFEPSISLFYWLLPGIFSLGMLSILSYHFAGRDYPAVGVVYWIAGMALNLGLNVVFLPTEGTYIAALSSSISYTVLLILFVRLFAKGCGGYETLRPRAADLERWVGAVVRRST